MSKSTHSEVIQIREKLEEENKKNVLVALFGQPGAGKSSLINKIIGKEVAEVGVETDKTVKAAIYDHNGLKFVDLPGYGTTNFPKENYFEKMTGPNFKINDSDLFLCVTSGKLHDADSAFFRELIERKKTCIFVVNKRDELWEQGVTLKDLEKRKKADIEKHVGKKVKVIFTSCRDNYGLDELINEISVNLDVAKKERWERSAKAYSEDFLERKKVACEKYITLASIAAAGNALNPIPGADIAIDLSILVGLFKQIQNDYGLSKEALMSLKQSQVLVVGQLAKNLLEVATKSGLLTMLKKFAGREAVKQFAKYIPFFGQAVAAGVGYALTSNVGRSHLEDCHKLATEILKNNLDF